MTVCAIKLCRNHSEKNDTNNKINFHRFPADPVWANHWINIVRKSRKDECWTPVQRTVICSDHFRKSDVYTTKQGIRRIRRGAVPSKALFLSGVESAESDSSDVESSITPQFCVTVNKSPQFNKTSCENEISCGSQDCSHISIKTNDSHKTETEIPTQNQTEEIEDFSDLDSVFDSSQLAKIRKKLRKKIALQNKHVRLIKSLKKKNIRLKNKIILLEKKIENLQKQT